MSRLNSVHYRRSDVFLTEQAANAAFADRSARADAVLVTARALAAADGMSVAKATALVAAHL